MALYGSAKEGNNIRPEVDRLIGEESDDVVSGL
jgi:hypothetical protein